MTKFLLGFFSFGWLRGLDFLPSLLLRLFLAPMLWISGSKKLGLFVEPDINWLFPVTWFDSATYDASVKVLSETPMPIPEIMNGVIGGIEVIGAFLLVIGFAVRWISLPLLALIGFTILLALGDENVVTAGENLLMTHAYNTDVTIDHLTVRVMYFLMVLSLFFMGAGRFFSIDWFLYRKLQRSIDKQEVSSSASQDNPFNLGSNAYPHNSFALGGTSASDKKF